MKAHILAVVSIPCIGCPIKGYRIKKDPYSQKVVGPLLVETSDIISCHHLGCGIYCIKTITGEQFYCEVLQ